MSGKELFLSPSNLKENFNSVADEVLKITGYNINNNRKLRETFNNMATIVISKTPSDNQNLITLNTLLNDRSITYFKKVISDKRNKNMNSQGSNSSNNNYNNNNYSNSNNNGGLSIYSQEKGFSYMNDNQDMNKKYNELMQDRNKVDLSVNDNSYMPQPVNDASEYNKLEQDSRTNELQSMYKSQSENVINNGILENNKKSEYNIKSFNLDEDIMSLTSNPGEDLPLYQNIKTLQKQDNSNPMELLKIAEQQRNEQMNSFHEIQDNQELARDAIINKGSRDIMLERNNTDAITKIDQVAIDPKVLHSKNEDWQSRMNKHVEENIVSDNIVSNLSEKLDNLLQDKLKNSQREAQPNYYERVHYISVNSADRKWENQTEDDTRYNFQVKFKAGQDFEGAGINREYKNIISVELVSAILPIDAHIEPFDTRIYLNIMKYPYLLLRIDELDGVFMGTNSHNDRAFSTLVFDKFHNTETLTSDHITSNVNSDVKTSFSNEFKRGYVRFNPAYFEKKKYYNAPLASLNKMTIHLTDHRGKAFNTQNDVVDINTTTGIQFTGAISTLTASDFEINPTNAFPYRATSSTKMIKITTSKYFSNRLFRIGDRIVINGFDMNAIGANNSEFVNFINREEGHIIINMDREVNNNTTNSNDGQLNAFYIPPPGTLDADNRTLDATTYYDETTLNFTDATYGRLINTDLQSHFLFRIVTREANVSNVTKPINI